MPGGTTIEARSGMTIVENDLELNERGFFDPRSDLDRTLSVQPVFDIKGLSLGALTKDDETKGSLRLGGGFTSLSERTSSLLSSLFKGGKEFLRDIALTYSGLFVYTMAPLELRLSPPNLRTGNEDGTSGGDGSDGTDGTDYYQIYAGAVPYEFDRFGLEFTAGIISRSDLPQMIKNGTPAMARDGFLFVCKDYYPNLSIEDKRMVKDLLAVRAYGEEIFKGHPAGARQMALRLELAIANKMEMLDRYLTFLETNDLMKLRDAVIFMPAPPKSGIAYDDPSGREALTLAEGFYIDPNIRNRYKSAGGSDLDKMLVGGFRNPVAYALALQQVSQLFQRALDEVRSSVSIFKDISNVRPALFRVLSVFINEIDNGYLRYDLIDPKIQRQNFDILVRELREVVGKGLGLDPAQLPLQDPIFRPTWSAIEKMARAEARLWRIFSFSPRLSVVDRDNIWFEFIRSAVWEMVMKEGNNLARQYRRFEEIVDALQGLTDFIGQLQYKIERRDFFGNAREKFVDSNDFANEVRIALLDELRNTLSMYSRQQVNIEPVLPVLASFLTTHLKKITGDSAVVISAADIAGIKEGEMKTGRELLKERFGRLAATYAGTEDEGAREKIVAVMQGASMDKSPYALFEEVVDKAPPLARRILAESVGNDVRQASLEVVRVYPFVKDLPVEERDLYLTVLRNELLERLGPVAVRLMKMEPSFFDEIDAKTHQSLKDKKDGPELWKAIGLRKIVEGQISEGPRRGDEEIRRGAATLNAIKKLQGDNYFVMGLGEWEDDLRQKVFGGIGLMESSWDKMNSVVNIYTVSGLKVLAGLHKKLSDIGFSDVDMSIIYRFMMEERKREAAAMVETETQGRITNKSAMETLDGVLIDLPAILECFKQLRRFYPMEGEGLDSFVLKLSSLADTSLSYSSGMKSGDAAVLDDAAAFLGRRMPGLTVRRKEMKWMREDEGYAIHGTLTRAQFNARLDAIKRLGYFRNRGLLDEIRAHIEKAGAFYTPYMDLRDTRYARELLELMSDCVKVWYEMYINSKQFLLWETIYKIQKTAALLVIRELQLGAGYKNFQEARNDIRNRIEEIPLAKDQNDTVMGMIYGALGRFFANFEQVLPAGMKEALKAGFAVNSGMEIEEAFRDPERDYYELLKIIKSRRGSPSQKRCTVLLNHWKKEAGVIAMIPNPEQALREAEKFLDRMLAIHKELHPNAAKLLTEEAVKEAAIAWMIAALRSGKRDANFDGLYEEMKGKHRGVAKIVHDRKGEIKNDARIRQIIINAEYEEWRKSLEN